jgi:NADH-quinone oxidoreductase subunit N
VDEAVQRLAGAWELILPEIVLIAAACIHFLAGPFLVSERGDVPAGLRHRWGGLALAALLTAAWIWWQHGPEAEPSPLGPFRLDDLAWFVRGLSLAAGAVLLLTGWNQIGDSPSAEHHACLLLIVAGTSLIAAANDLVVVFLALELVSIPTYVFLYLSRHDAAGQEAVIKYFLLSIFSSAVVLFGMSYLYGIAGTTNLAGIYAAVSEPKHAMPACVAAGAVIAGLGFRLAAVLFHFYAPDVFQGTSIGGAAMLSLIPKIAGLVALIRLLAPSADHQDLVDLAQPALWVLAALTMTVGNVLALVQTDVRRLFAYSSIAHAGYMLVGLAVIPDDRTGIRGMSALLFYLAIYGTMTIGLFAVLAAIRPRPEDQSAEALATENLAGLSRSHPVAALLMSVFLFSLTGLPPTAGFFGKLNLLLAAWSAETEISRALAVLMAANAAVAAWYYLRLVAVMYLQPAVAPLYQRALPAPEFVAATACAVATIGLFIAPDWLWQAASRIAG